MERTKLDEVIDRHRSEKGALISILQDIQRAEGYISEAVMDHLSIKLNIPLSEVFRTVSYFDTAFSLQPPSVGRHAVKVCRGTACHVKRGAEVMNELKEMINKEGADDMCFVQAVRCLGCCGTAPAIEIDGKVLDKETAKSTIIKLKREK